MQRPRTLAREHGRQTFVWLRYARKGSGEASITYEEAVEEALCFGWIDSKVEPADGASWRQYFCPRKPKGVWSKVNKERAERRIACGRMTPVGMRVIDAAKPDGSWASLDAVENPEMPEDLASALNARQGARAFFASPSRTSRKQTLFWIASAKREETRAQRISKAADAAGRGERLY